MDAPVARSRKFLTETQPTISHRWMPALPPAEPNLTQFQPTSYKNPPLFGSGVPTAVPFESNPRSMPNGTNREARTPAREL
jgi:hypothetical protein